MLRDRRLRLVAFAVALASGPSAGTEATAPGGFGGGWIAAVDVPILKDGGTAHFDLQQQGSELSGFYSGRFGRVPVSGTAREGSVVLRFVIEVEGQPIPVTYSGELDEGDLWGSVRFGEAASGTFVATRAR
jgi:hypothetical protein